MGTKRDQGISLFGGAVKASSLLTTAMVLCVAAPALAADEDQGVSSRDEGAIIVTANRRAQNVQDVPIAITTLSGDKLAATSQTDVDDILDRVPGVQVSAGANGSSWNIRGVSSVGGGGEIDPGVSFSVDGVYNPFDNIALMPYFDLERVEVLRGPQGTLYGRNAVAGAINVITKDPKLGELSGFLQGGIGNYSARSATGAVNVPVGDKLALRVSADTRSHHGYISNGGADQDQWAVRAKALYEVSPDVQVRLTGDYAKSTGLGNSDVFLPLYSDNPWKSDEIVGDENVEQYSFSGQIDANLGGVTWTIIPAYRHAEQVRNSTTLGSVPLTYNRVVNGQWTVETRLASNDSDPLSWVAGAYFYDNVQSFRMINPPNLDQSPLKTRSYAAFGQLTYGLSPGVRFTGGLRFTSDHKEGVNRNYGVTPTAVVTYDQTWNTWTWRAGTEFDVGPENMLYASVSTGFKAGGSFAAAGDNTFGPEHLTAYMVGSKNRFLDGDLQLNVEAYYYKYDDLQVAYVDFFPEFGGVGRKVVNAGKATTYGIEAEFEGRLTQNDRISGNVAYFHGKYDQYVQPPGLGPSVDYSGAELPLPNWTGALNYEHRFELANGGYISFLGEMQWQGDVFRLVSRDARSLQTGFAKFDASLGYRAPEDRWSLTAFVRNIGNTVVKTGVFVLGPNATTWLEPPRTWGLNLRANF